MKPDQTVDYQVKQVTDCGCECKCDLTKVPVSLQNAVFIGSDAVEEDDNENYENAIWLYKESEKWFLHAIEHDEKNEKAKDRLRKYCKVYTDRVEELKSILDERRRIQKLRELAVTERIR